MDSAEIDARLVAAEEWCREAADQLRRLRQHPERATMGVGTVMITADMMVHAAADGASGTLKDGVKLGSPSEYLGRVPWAVVAAAERRLDERS